MENVGERRSRYRVRRRNLKEEPGLCGKINIKINLQEEAWGYGPN